ncbi:MAG: hypothetical protein ACO263_07055 [Cyclobacteriaceae bacterium]
MKPWILSVIGIVFGTLAGYLYWQEIGCLSGTCIITSSPVNSSLYGAVMGFVASGLFVKEKKDQQKNPD